MTELTKLRSNFVFVKVRESLQCRIHQNYSNPDALNTRIFFLFLPTSFLSTLMTSTQPAIDTPPLLQTPEVFRLSPIIKVTLINLYLALTTPLPILAWVTQDQWSLAGYLTSGLAIGLLALIAALSEQVVLDESSIRVCYPTWVPSFFRSGWQLAWSEIAALNCRSTGQGGLVYYLVTATKDRAYLLPMRVAGFNRLTQQISAKTGLDTKDVRPLSQPWMYFLLFSFTIILWGTELGTGWLVWQNPPI